MAASSISPIAATIRSRLSTCRGKRRSWSRRSIFERVLAAASAGAWRPPACRRLGFLAHCRARWKPGCPSRRRPRSNAPSQAGSCCKRSTAGSPGRPATFASTEERGSRSRDRRRARSRSRGRGVSGRLRADRPAAPASGSSGRHCRVRYAGVPGIRAIRRWRDRESTRVRRRR